jgi:hypothetical protein
MKSGSLPVGSKQQKKNCAATQAIKCPWLRNKKFCNVNRLEMMDNGIPDGNLGLAKPNSELT